VHQTGSKSFHCSSSFPPPSSMGMTDISKLVIGGEAC